MVKQEFKNPYNRIDGHLTDARFETYKIESKEKKLYIRSLIDLLRTTVGNMYEEQDNAI